MRIPIVTTRHLVVVALLALTACAQRSSTPRTGTRDQNLITLDELANVDAATLFDAVNRLRPQFLRSRGVTSLQDPTPRTAVVYLDGQRVGRIEFLERMSPLGVFSVRYMPPVDASSRYGLDHEGGAILVSTRRAMPPTNP